MDTANLELIGRLVCLEIAMVSAMEPPLQQRLLKQKLLLLLKGMLMLKLFWLLQESQHLQEDMLLEVLQKYLDLV